MKPVVPTLALPILLTGCVFVAEDDHLQRIEAAVDDTDDTGDTDAPPPSGTGPVVEDAQFRFRFDPADNYNGVFLYFRATDVDGDLEGGVVQIDGEDAIPLSGTARVDDWWAVPLDHAVTTPCNPPDRTVQFTVHDAAANPSAAQSVSLSWQTFLHDESENVSADSCEPCVAGIQLTDLPAVACGIKATQGFQDWYDDVQIAPGANQVIEATVNFGPGAEYPMSFGLSTGPTEPFSLVAVSTEGTGSQLVFSTGPAAVPWFLTVWGGDDEFGLNREATWSLYIQPELPPQAP